mmetsp:Transcript_8241/g.21268  ORF Transcript_8241/g.21268 Transcript_8241/m.21268 type:complete len:226 (+) Transcript_8241:667-1344(+)|eukprot:CAMPEP_0119411408 /NCGR_PEP_ID=MMETSP1335-20130426/4163_1 /TAXON_ID=259385 /ORGANISM="Chrysoculter rhomboideus, Strain RCC1486" /LENGTH=225 /DNA_ID=CAMNT_0007436043 /DNA_START=686 /DNA_END=1363 /DNA_ORIENTATION=-
MEKLQVKLASLITSSLLPAHVCGHGCEAQSVHALDVLPAVSLVDVEWIAGRRARLQDNRFHSPHELRVSSLEDGRVQTLRVDLHYLDRAVAHHAEDIVHRDAFDTAGLHHSRAPFSPRRLWVDIHYARASSHVAHVECDGPAVRRHGERQDHPPLVVMSKRHGPIPLTPVIHHGAPGQQHSIFVQERLKGHEEGLWVLREPLGVHRVDIATSNLNAKVRGVLGDG